MPYPAHVCLLTVATKVYSRSVDPRKLRVGVKYYVVHSCIHQNHILRLQVCTRSACANCAQKCKWLRQLFAAFSFYWWSSQSNPNKFTGISKLRDNCCGGRFYNTHVQLNLRCALAIATRTANSEKNMKRVLPYVHCRRL